MLEMERGKKEEGKMERRKEGRKGKEERREGGRERDRNSGQIPVFKETAVKFRR